MKELKPLKQYKLRSGLNARYVPILDRDPVFAARAIIKKDIPKFYEYLKEAFNEIRENEIKQEILVNTILFSHENFLWFSVMLKEFENILEIKEEFEIPYEKIPKEEGIEAPIVYQPFRVSSYKDGFVILSNYKILSKTLLPINNYRIKYLMEDYDMSDFIDDCFPSWYLLKPTTIFEQYSEKTNVRVRVDYMDREFKYFIAGASDNWKEIQGVPPEIDDVVAALIFRSYSDD